MYNYTAFSTLTIKFENKFHFITDTITLYYFFVFSNAHLMWSLCWPWDGCNSFIKVGLDVEAWFSDSQKSTTGFSDLGGWPANESIFEDRFSIILRISLCPVSASFILLPTDFSIFSEISEKSRSKMLGAFSVLWLAASGSPNELDTESLLAFLLEDLSGILGFKFTGSVFPTRNKERLRFLIFNWVL